LAIGHCLVIACLPQAGILELGYLYQLSLPLLMFNIFTNNAHHALSFYYFTALTNSFY
jgi:hypothetical protein